MEVQRAVHPVGQAFEPDSQARKPDLQEIRRKGVMSRLQRTHTCGELRESQIGQTVVLNGWVNTYRNQGSLVFIDVRDRYGVTQVVFDPERRDLLAAAQELRSEFVVAIKGKVAPR